MSKWTLERVETWPFGYRIRDEVTGSVLFSDSLACHSSRDKSFEEAFEARNFREGRDKAAIFNQRQAAAYTLAASAPELLAALKMVVSRCGPKSRDGQIAREAIAKAEGSV